MGHPVIIQKWWEYERGWGSRPDGISLHLTDEDRIDFVNAYYRRLREEYGSNVPDEYSTAEQVEIGEATDAQYEALVAMRPDAPWLGARKKLEDWVPTPIREEKVGTAVVDEPVVKDLLIF